MAKREWITLDRSDGGTPYLIMVEREGNFHGYQVASCSGVMEVLGEAAYAEAIAEEADTFRIFRLTEFGPLPVQVEKERCPGIGMISVHLNWRNPTLRGKAARSYERGFYKIIDI